MSGWLGVGPEEVLKEARPLMLGPNLSDSHMPLSHDHSLFSMDLWGPHMTGLAYFIDVVKYVSNIVIHV